QNTRRRPIHGLEHRQQRQCRRKRDGRRTRLRVEFRPQIAGAAFPTGPVRRRDDWWRRSRCDCDRVLWFDESGAAWELLLLLSARWQQQAAVQVPRLAGVRMTIPLLDL